MPELLGFSNLTPFQDRLARNLSGGMRQKLGLACALIHRPRLLFLDEPTFGVDPISRREFWEILYGLLGTGITIFLSTAYMDEAERAHRVGLMHHGRLAGGGHAQGHQELLFRGNSWRPGPPTCGPPERSLSDHPLVQHSLAMGDRLMLTVDERRHGDGAPQGGPGAGRPDRVALEPAEPTLEELFVQIVRQDEE